MLTINDLIFFLSKILHAITLFEQRRRNLSCVWSKILRMIKTTVLWSVRPCCLVVVCWSFRENFSFHYQQLHKGREQQVLLKRRHMPNRIHGITYQNTVSLEFLITETCSVWRVKPLPGTWKHNTKVKTYVAFEKLSHILKYNLRDINIIFIIFIYFNIIIFYIIIILYLYNLFMSWFACNSNTHISF